MEAVKTTQEKRVICYQCSMACKTSKVYPEYTAPTVKIENPPYFDEEGRYHSHGDACRSVKYRCSFGHEWADSEANNVCWCGWTSEKKA